ncbi:L-seryl-tRNA(Sec) selenium transferase [Crassaminicella thermophila]|uniref:L-seryl-tRNA(Sec) selenium transferase n=1 Tax=Crassaminicella thermophila TaxID=2599308 RepID=A0A5C0SCV5_CRATE|nr:L-seryl-tRNA(Sec) selenium transferase [Crassaminicella thermophila]QEK12051.1 L-seryl-tRNA(Sec) selenium transferase [Crassaminicella thermophila]
MSKKRDLFAQIPKVDDLLNKEQIKSLGEKVSRTIIVESVRENIDRIRKKIIKLKDCDVDTFKIDYDELLENIVNSINNKNMINLRKVINATGVVLHTNLGRALLCESIKKDVWDVASSYSTLEFDIKSGKRGSRYAHVEGILSKLTGAESAMVVNNNAAAVLLVLGTLAKNKEVIVSRGQLVEIGGAFRVPDVMLQSGAKLVEVGTTNKTHLLDYEDAINEETAALLKVHTSNYKIIGFTQEVDLKDLIVLGKKYNIPIIEDIGSGTFVDFSRFGLCKEPTVQESITMGVDIVTFSGDKLLGGPQAGIIVGKKKYIDQMKKNPITRAFRVDKLTLAALEGTLRLYLNEKEALRKIPTLRMLTISLEEIKQKADLLYKRLNENIKNCFIEKINGFSQVGGGSMPLEKLPTILISIKPKFLSINKFEEMLRNNKTPIITRISEDRVLMDVRTIDENEFNMIVEGIVNILSNWG